MSPNDQAGSESGASRTVIERPPPGLARGKYPAPAWVVSTLGVTVAFIGIAYFARRILHKAKR